MVSHYHKIMEELTLAWSFYLLGLLDINFFDFHLILRNFLLFIYVIIVMCKFQMRSTH